MTDKDEKLRGVRVMSNPRTGRIANREAWVDEPLQNAIHAALKARDWSISDLGRAIGSQPSLVSRWMMGARPNTESVVRISQVLGIDLLHLLVLSGHIPPSARAPVDERVTMLRNKLAEVEMTDERFAYLNSLIETMRKRPVSAEPPLDEQAQERPA